MAYCRHTLRLCSAISRAHSWLVPSTPVWVGLLQVPCGLLWLLWLCGGSHSFLDCLQLSKPAAKKFQFHFRLHFHQPAVFFPNRHATESTSEHYSSDGRYQPHPVPSASVSGPCLLSPGADRGRNCTTPLWMTGRGGKFYDKAGDGQAEQYVQTVCSCAFQDHPKTQRMPISVQNKMPHV